MAGDGNCNSATRPLQSDTDLSANPLQVCLWMWNQPRRPLVKGPCQQRSAERHNAAQGSTLRSGGWAEAPARPVADYGWHSPC